MSPSPTSEHRRSHAGDGLTEPERGHSDTVTGPHGSGYNHPDARSYGNTGAHPRPGDRGGPHWRRAE